MNDSTPTADASGGSNPSNDQPGPASGRSSNRFFTWFREIGMVRGNERWFAGVAGGIAAKASIDPLIVRGIFVVLALLGGPGILLYLAGWLLLPDLTGRIHLEEVVRGRASTGMIVTTVILGALLVIPLIFRTLSAALMLPWSWDVWESVPGLGWVGTLFTVLWWAVILPGLIIWLIVWLSRRNSQGSAHMPQGNEPGGGASSGPANSAAGGAPGGATGGEPRNFSEQATEWGAQATAWGEQAAAWGEQAGRDASEWARTGLDHHRAHRIGSAHTVLTIALALLGAGAAAGWAISLSVERDLVLTAGLLGAVTVLAVSLIIAGIRGRQTGWVGFLSFLGVLALVFAPFTSLLPDQTRFVPFGTISTVAEDHDPDNAVVMIAGNSTIDLTQLTDTAQARHIEVWLLAGNGTIEMPSDLPVRVEANVLAGNILSGGAARSDGENSASQQSGLMLDRVATANLAGAQSSEIIDVHVRVMFGRVYFEGADGLFTKPAAEQLLTDHRLTELEAR